MTYGPIVILTGAGISAESGIKTFRASDGLWEDHRVEEVASPEGFRANPDLVYRFYNDRRQGLLAPEIQPNPAHVALARLEKEYEEKVTLVTQNIDNLHERGGSRNILHMHGELLKSRCESCGQVHFTEKSFTNDDSCTSCQVTGSLRPHIVWFGEIPFYMDEIDRDLSDAGVFISVGTSGNVYPAAGFVQTARESGALCIEVNPEPTYSGFFTKFVVGKAGTEVPRLVDKILNKDLISR